jgi:glycosyltransferase involved in cell wall biosynthesis
MAAPRVTVLMSVKNGEPYVGMAVGSILGQTFRDFRFLILDNASTDSTRETIRAFGDPRIDLVALPEDIGQTGALNKGLGMIDSEYVARMDGDDVSLPDRLARQVAFLDAHPEVAVVGAHALTVDSRGDPIMVLRNSVAHEDMINSLPFCNPLFHPVVTFRLDAVRQAGGYDASFAYAQDYALWLQLARTHRLANLDSIEFLARLHEGQLTRANSFQRRRVEDNLRIAENILNVPGLSPQAREAVGFRRALLVAGIEGRRAGASSLLRQLRSTLPGCLANRVLWRSLARLLRSVLLRLRLRLLARRLARREGRP